jgi:DNA-binding NarL/FixJ family response regulator
MGHLHRRVACNVEGAAPRPALLLLDLSMPKKNGLRALEALVAVMKAIGDYWFEVVELAEA